MSKKKNKKEYPICSCCGLEMHRTEMRAAVSEMERIERALYKKNYKELEIDSYYSFLDSDFDWACDNCLHTKKAINANTGSQNYGSNPHFAYFDSVFSCNTCHKEFTFGKEEKKFWFESLKFWNESTPINCVDCRKETRQLKNQNKTISNILKKSETELSTPEIKLVIEIYTDWKKVDKMRYYESLLRKKQ